MSTSSTTNEVSKKEKLIFAPGSNPSTTQAAQFAKGSLDITDLDPSPIHQFNTWFKAANDAGLKQTEACTFSTASLPSGRVSARIVYLKELEPASLDLPFGGFVLYSNWGTSRKAADVESNKFAALTFFYQGAAGARRGLHAAPDERGGADVL
jgi:pyridoxamine 5'-phosphate oxidase